MNGVWDWRAYYAAYLDSEFAYYRDFFAFRIQANPRVKCGVSMLYKPWSIDRAWLPEDPRGVQVSMAIAMICMAIDRDMHGVAHLIAATAHAQCARAHDGA